MAGCPTLFAAPHIQCRTNSQSKGASVGLGESGDEPARKAPTWFVQVRYGAELTAGWGTQSRSAAAPRRACAILAAMIEISGDSSRDGCWALVRLRVDGGRIVDADADGLDTDLRGLSLLEAAAVGGETLAVDALANAIGPVFRARPGSRPGRRGDERRRRQRGRAACVPGRARSASRSASGPIPRGADSERACCSPAAVLAARRTCHALGLPHVTLDLREAIPPAVVEPFVRGYARGETPNPCTRCNGGFRFARAARVRAPRRAPRGSPPATTRGSSSIAGGCCSRGRPTRDKDQSYMLAPARPGAARPGLVPARGADGRRRRARRPRGPGLAAAQPAPRARRRASSAATTTARSSSGGGWRRRRGRSSTRQGRTLGTHDGYWRYTPGPAPRASASAAGTPLYALRTSAATNTVVVGPRAVARPDEA